MVLFVEGVITTGSGIVSLPLTSSLALAMGSGGTVTQGTAYTSWTSDVHPPHPNLEPRIPHFWSGRRAPKPPIAIRPPSTCPSVQPSQPNQIDGSNPRRGSTGLELRLPSDSRMRRDPCPATRTRTASAAAGHGQQRAANRNPSSPPEQERGGAGQEAWTQMAWGGGGDVRLAESQSRKPVGCSDPDSASERSAARRAPDGRHSMILDPIQSIASARGWALPVSTEALRLRSCARCAWCFQGELVDTRIAWIAQEGISF